MKIDREKFLSAVAAVGMTGAVAACGSEPPPAAAEPQETVGQEVAPPLAPAPAPPPPPAAPAPVPEPVVEEAGPTPE